ncbi:flagellar protein FliS [Sphingomonas sp. 28-63-12]|uniref:flagellar export chaperone FliS n=1 Tax=Sphingomonas sp. 28-63-12 TaxID=1970434 RepID=UPI000BCE979E|nr:MAG: flagellar export chaperone FliS [Sphingomonas sp. 28-63-12]
MAHYATTLGRNPDATYRQIDIVGRTGESDPHQLVALLYEELGRALRAVVAAMGSGNRMMKSEKATRAISILFALEAGLDFERGGDLSKTLAGLYRGARTKLIDASLGDDPAPFVDVATNMAQIADAWTSVGKR